jgi:hypothetical protein
LPGIADFSRREWRVLRKRRDLPLVWGFSPTEVSGPGVLLAAKESNLELLSTVGVGMEMPTDDAW